MTSCVGPPRGERSIFVGAECGLDGVTFKFKFEASRFEKLTDMRYTINVMRVFCMYNEL
jgi:hypothetical protein